MISNIIFDLDGTVIDSSECIYSVYAALFKEMNIPMPQGKQKRRLIGPPTETTLRNMGVDNPVPYGVRFRELYKEVDLPSTNRLYDGIAELLDKLTARGYRLYIGSSKNEPYAKRILGFLGVVDKFTAVYGSRYDLNRTAKCDVLNALIKDCSLKKEECILIGDTVFDAEGAEKVGIRFGAVTYGFGESEDLQNTKAEFFVDSVENIAVCLSSIL